ncbi:hypothetical protein HanXRQr2_Chr12g0525011 [Helianthus annuus]|uniref:Uncharacterized protein n=1 Tax=Helianthus annuus TaxID=4232 RepID=A0A9K3EME1_HELAN|nr:hypothetical protein HanXRQr2_Chr12g0525011 [Helianthus annuus]KAJ0861359.1 hypothetical protein HanPSC8_Chr12g0505781 [Helianthus annuus]
MYSCASSCLEFLKVLDIPNYAVKNIQISEIQFNPVSLKFLIKERVTYMDGPYSIWLTKFMDLVPIFSKVHE